MSLSEQQLIDCATEWSSGCIGGETVYAFQYASKNGLASAAEYPYEAKNNNCKENSGSVVKVKEAVAVDPTESALKEAVGKYELATILHIWYINILSFVILLFCRSI